MTKLYNAMHGLLPACIYIIHAYFVDVRFRIIYYFC